MAKSAHSFPQSSRLGKPADYQSVFAKAVKSSDNHLTVLASRNCLGYARLGLAVSKKSVRLAVERNRLKRLARESFRLRRCDLGGRDFIVLARKANALADNKTLLGSLDKHWTNLIRRCNPC